MFGAAAHGLGSASVHATAAKMAKRAAITQAFRAAPPPPMPGRAAQYGRAAAAAVRKHRVGIGAGALGIGVMAAGTHGLRRRPAAPPGVKTRGNYSSGIYRY